MLRSIPEHGVCTAIRLPSHLNRTTAGGHGDGEPAGEDWPLDLIPTRSSRARPATRPSIDKAMLQEGQFLRTKIVEGIREQAPGGRAFAPLAPTSSALRRFRGFGGTKALIAGGDLGTASRSPGRATRSSSASTGPQRRAPVSRWSTSPRCTSTARGRSS